MRIVDIKTFVVGNPWKNWLFVKVYTDSGVVGLGEATGGLSTRPNEADVLELKRVTVGEDPTRIGQLWDKMLKARYLKPSTGMVGIELACWDILARSLEVPVWQLLGGKQRESLRVYANGWYQGPRDPAAFADRATGMVERGYTALKFDPFGPAYLRMDKGNERLSMEIVAAVKEAVAGRAEILIEGHDRFSPDYAVRLSRMLSEFDPLFFEAPVVSLEPEPTVAVARASAVPIATGERFVDLKQFVELLKSHAVGIIQPEVMHLGLEAAVTVSRLAAGYSATVACHQAQSPFCTAMNAHLHSVLPNFLLQECFDDSLEDWTWDLLDGAPRVKNGALQVTNEPGFGVTLNEEVAEEYPYNEGHFLRLFEKGWEYRRPSGYSED